MSTEALGRSDSPFDGTGAVPPARLAELLRALQAVRDGDFSVRLPGDLVGLDGKIADTFNDIVARERPHGRGAGARRPGRGKRGQDARARQVRRSRAGAWGEMESSVNTLIDDLVWPTTEVTRAISAVAQGDLLQTVPRSTSMVGR